MDWFEVVIPTLSTTDRKTMLTQKVYTNTREDIPIFIRQHDIRVYDVKVLRRTDGNIPCSDMDLLDHYAFASNKNDQIYNIITCEYFIRDAIDHIGAEFAESSMFGDLIIRTDLPIIDIINRHIESIRHSVILDYLLLDDNECVDTVMNHWKTFSNKALSYVGNPSESDEYYDYIYESLHKNSIYRGVRPEPITIEGYIEYVAMMLSDRVDD